MFFQKVWRKNLLIVLLFSCSSLFAQEDSSHLRVSLLTCGTGPEPWETFGHTAIRITDSMSGTDDVFNYGTFNGYDDDFLLNFTRGKLLYYLSYYPYPNFVDEYARDNRSVREQELKISGKDKMEIYNFLLHNARNENKYYKYDFFFDNCATRIRDAFPKALGSGFKYAYTLPEHKSISFRNIINQYFYRVHWQRFGVNILLGSRIDKVMTNSDVMFLPDYLADGIAGATLDGRKIAHPSKLIVDGSPKVPAGVNEPFLLTSFIALLTILGLSVPRLKRLGNVMIFFNLFLSGFIGCFIMLMWMATDHQGCSNNLNLLWALPTNLVAAFIPRRNNERYSLIAMGLIFVSLLLHILKVQELPILELSPLLLSLLTVHSFKYKR
ncbi:MAG TPA: DUF4105 domain-containing protein [Flavipsychrobacter sp.]|nr:DUF4105 domain-containing protein [Flavipsychrobacter sp.]